MAGLASEDPRDSASLVDAPALPVDLVHSSSSTDSSNGGLADSPHGASPEVPREVRNLPEVVVIIPARGGSAGVTGKNVRTVGQVPLIHYAIQTAWGVLPGRVIVSTDSDEVAGVALAGGYDVEIDRTFYHTHLTTVDQLAQHYHDKLGSDVVLVVLQPTTFGDSLHAIEETIQTALKEPGWYTITQAAKGTLWAQSDFGESYQLNNPGRLNRQFVEDAPSILYKEVGIRVIYGPQNEFWWSAPFAYDLIDIDTVEDFAAAETRLHKDYHIHIYYRSGPGKGRGHELRARTLADALQDYQVSLFNETHWPPPNEHPDIRINDFGDTLEMDMLRYLQHAQVIAIEDEGPGGRLATRLFNPFENPRHAVLRPEFYNLPDYEVRPEANKIMLTFGGQDNHKMRGYVTTALAFHLGPSVQMVEPRDGHMAQDMLSADLLICAGGTTVLEAMKVGVPTIVVPALPSEAKRYHLDPEFGVIALGIMPTYDAIREMVRRVMKDRMLRQDMSRRMRRTQVGEGVTLIRRAIEDLCNS